MWSVQFLQCETSNQTQIGATIDLDRRLQQHNGLKSGGARATAGKSWRRICSVRNFPHERAALQFEWAWKYHSKAQIGTPIQRRIKALLQLLGCEKPTSKADDYQTQVHDLDVIWDDEKDVSFQYPGV